MSKSNFIEISLRHGYFPVNLLHILSTKVVGGLSTIMKDLMAYNRILKLELNTYWEVCLIKNYNNRSSHPEVFFRKGVLKICSKFTGEHPCQSVITIKLLCNFVEIALRHACSPVYLLHIFRTPFPKNTSGGMLLNPSLNVSTKLISFTWFLKYFLVAFYQHYPWN